MCNGAVLLVLVQLLLGCGGRREGSKPRLACERAAGKVVQCRAVLWQTDKNIWVSDNLDETAPYYTVSTTTLATTAECEK